MAKPDFLSLRTRLRGNQEVLTEKIRQLNEETILKLKSREIEQITLEGIIIGPEDINITYKQSHDHMSFYQSDSNEKV